MRCGTTSPPHWRLSARRKNVVDKAAAIQDALRSQQLGQLEVVADAYGASVRALWAVLTVLNTQIKTLQGQVEAHLGKHPAAEISVSQPGLGPNTLQRDHSLDAYREAYRHLTSKLLGYL
ncbi:hypothetical protein [Nocardia sp. SC052]|uniref:hypothetical protein n=1 Tax=Nocardia sichangensis TaxID=3385975 RepID=UPI0039A3CA86